MSWGRIQWLLLFKTVLIVGVLIMQALLFGVHIRASDFCKLPMLQVSLSKGAWADANSLQQ